MACKVTLVLMILVRLETFLVTQTPVQGFACVERLFQEEVAE